MLQRVCRNCARSFIDELENAARYAVQVGALLNGFRMKSPLDGLPTSARANL
jgi:hypothetical protein